ncbi:MAG: type I-G CRISPR-associated protein Cas8g1/Csx17, partial [Verrucomicrobiia bacterium]
MNTQIVLNGCSPTPIAFYLKALGVLRLVSEQKDPTAKGCWQRDRFVLYTKLTEKELLDFFLYEYEPTPIVAPWNGGSGFYPKDKKSA